VVRPPGQGDPVELLRGGHEQGHRQPRLGRAALEGGDQAARPGLRERGEAVAAGGELGGDQGGRAGEGADGLGRDVVDELDGRELRHELFQDEQVEGVARAHAVVHVAAHGGQVRPAERRPAVVLAPAAAAAARRPAVARAPPVAVVLGRRARRRAQERR